MIAGNPGVKQVSPDIIHGFVLDRATREPILWVRVNVLNSDEVSLTNDKGEFKIIAWQKFPVTLRFQHQDFETVHLRITCVTDELVIMLRNKYR